MKKLKPSDLFEGPNSSLRRTFDEATKESRVLCFSCGKPIKGEDLGGVTSIGGKEAWFHKWLPCSIDVKLQRDS